jgi:TetR/AcrR family transcriptional regulator, fatty acid metabolism regulator protein
MRTKEGNKEKDILNAAIKVFAEYGYNDAKISKIAEVANVASGSVYLYYKSKDNILLCIFKQIWDQLSNELEVLINNSQISPIEKIDGMIDLIFDMFANNSPMGIIFVTEHNNPKLTREIKSYTKRFLNLGQSVLEDGKENGFFTTNLDFEIFSSFLFGGLRHLIHLWALDPVGMPLNAIRFNVKSIFKYGILQKDFKSVSNMNQIETKLN